MEKWAPINGTHGLLEISNQGRVRSLMRDGRILKTQTDNKGYTRVRVTIKRERMTFKVHREVAKAFLANPHNLPQVNHIDGNKQNNSAENLEWVTNIENAHHAIAAGLWENVFKTSKKVNDGRKTPVIAVCEDTGERRYFASVSDAERFFDTRHISDVLNGKRRSAAGNRFYRGGVIN